MNKKCLVLAAALCVSTMPVMASKSVSGDLFKGSIDFGYGSTSGNSETESFSLRSKARLSTESLDHDFELQAVSSSQDGVTNKERYFTAYQLNRDLSERVSSFLRADYDNDRFSGFEYQYSTAAGGSVSWKKSEEHCFQADLGLGYRFSELEDPDTLELVNEEELIVRLALDYEWNFTETAKFAQKVSSDKGRENTISRSDTTLRLTIAEPLSLVVGQHFKFYSDPQPNTESTDRETKVAISYAF